MGSLTPNLTVNRATCKLRLRAPSAPRALAASRLAP
jgi:hypothetical protein